MTTDQCIRVETAAEPSAGCPCCDPHAAAPQGYVTRDGEPLAIYFADWSTQPVPFADLVISLGRWDRGSTPADRRSVGFRLTVEAGALRPRLGDAAASRWAVLGFAGAMLDEKAATAEPGIAEFRALAELIAAEDPRLAALARGGDTWRLDTRSAGGGSFRAEAAKNGKHEVIR